MRLLKMMPFFFYVCSWATSFQVRFLDAETTKPIRKTPFKVESSNGIRCGVAPCPQERESFSITTDSLGVAKFAIKARTMSDTFFENPDYSTRDLGAADEVKKGGYTLDLEPKKRVDQDNQRRIKIYSKATGKALGKTSIAMRIEPAPDSKLVFSGESNSLGNLFYPLDLISKETAVWVHVKGFKPARLENGWVNFKVNLEPL